MTRVPGRAGPPRDSAGAASAATIGLCDDDRLSGQKAGALSSADATRIAVAQRLRVPVVVSDGHWTHLDFGDVEVIHFG